MKPMKELPVHVDREVILYLDGNREMRGWIGRVPNWAEAFSGFADEDRAFTSHKKKYDEYPAGETHGDLPWGRAGRGYEDGWDNAIGWDYYPPPVTIQEEEDFPFAA